MARELIAAAGVPVAAPSANVSGHVSATTAAHAAADLGHAVAMVLDAGPTRHGIESTIIGVGEGETPVLLRAGAVTREAAEAALGQALGPPPGHMRHGRIAAPGQLESHYAPRARLRLDARDARPGEAFVGFGPPPAGVDTPFTLSPTGDLVEAAANLFSLLRRLDDEGIARAAVMTIPGAGLGEAINDRLRRAAAPRRRHGRDGR
jgi:L-threonylcarbamoyladenylate synthase